ncbi:MAG: response regulator transcription factor [Deltaproteobacteria bacterium]|nr:response regulator transcription factor [Deltaproteobacteria bacterium]
MSTRVLLVEDDLRLAELVGEYLRASGLEVSHEASGALVVERVLSERPDVVILDLMLPGKDGLTILKELRPSCTVPVLMLTARTEEIDQVLGLELGADDYVAKPVSPRLLLARVKALLRRGDRDDERKVLGALTIDVGRREVMISGRPLELTTGEFDLLWVLARSAGQPVSRPDLLRDLRGIDYDGVDRSVDVRVSQLRRKLAEAGAPEIKTVRGVGYQLVAR